VVLALIGAFVFGVAPGYRAAAGEDAKQDGKPAAQLEWEKKLSPDELKQAAFAYVQEDPALPRVLLIGDSISIGYTAAVRELLKGKANVLRIPTNGGPTTNGVSSLKEWLEPGRWDVIHFNWGLHDIKRMKDGKTDITGEWQVNAAQYEKNLVTLTDYLENETKADLIWATTTPVPEGANGRNTGDEVKVNAIAAKVMAKRGVRVDDLYTYVAPHLAEYQQPKNVHFTEDGYRFLAKQVAAQIGEVLEKRAARKSGSAK
jgi:acyl-CoA thioesterase-1